MPPGSVRGRDIAPDSLARLVRQDDAEPAQPKEEALGSAAHAGLSTLLWGIDWREHFPLSVGDDGVVVEVADAQAAVAFAQDHFGDIFGASAVTQRSAPSGVARLRYLERACDVFVFRDHEQPVGLFIGNPVDWSTYYIRSTAFLRAYQGRALYQRFLQVLFETLGAAGVERVEAETAPSNLQCMTALMRQRFVASGTVLSERWGALTRFTKHLGEACEDEFLGRFCQSGEVHKRQNQRRRHDA